jgi:hypothetical protein
MSMRYTPGDAVAVVADDIALLIEVDPDQPLVDELFACVSARPGMEDLLEILVGHGLRRLPGFAVATTGADGLRVVVRGEFTATVAGQEPVRGSGLWADRELGDVPGLVLRAPAAGTGPQLPLVAGVVLAAEVAVRAEAAARTGEPAATPWLESVPAEPLVPAEPEAESFVPAFPAPEPIVPEPAVPAAAWADFAAADPPVVVPVPPPEVPAQGGLLIESFPWARDNSGVAPARLSAAAPVAAEAPVAPPDPVADGRANAFDQEASEMTVDRSRLIGRNSQSSVLVVAAHCPSGHLSPAYAADCRVCHQPLATQQPVEVPRPQLGVLRLSNGDTVPLDRGVIMGRNPRLPAGYSGEQPNLVRLSDPGKDISSQHLEVRLDYWHVLVTDLGSTNGTEVFLPGRPPVKLRPDDPLNIEPGTRVVLAGVLDFVFEVSG